MGKKSRRNKAHTDKKENVPGNAANSGQQIPTWKDFASDFVETSFGPSSLFGQAEVGHSGLDFHDAAKRWAAPLVVDEALCKKIAKLPLGDAVYMADVHETPSHDDTMPSGLAVEHVCLCGLVTKEFGSNGKHWNASGIGMVKNKADGLSLTLAMSTTMNDAKACDFKFSADMLLGTIAKACTNPGALTGAASTYFPIKPSRPRKIVMISEGMMVSISEIIKCMGIPEIGLADTYLAASMRSSFSTGAGEDERFSRISEAMSRAMETGNVGKMAQIYGQELRDNESSYYVSEERQPLGRWKPEHDLSTPKEWYARPGSEDCRYRMLWGWRTNMELACERNDASKIKDLCHRYPQDDVKEFVEGRMLLLKAAELGAAKACRALLKYADAAVDGVRSTDNRQEWIPIQEDAGDSEECKGMTPLFRAIHNGQRMIVDLLIHNGADVQLSPHGTAFTPLHLAVARGHANIAESLLFGGADVDATDGSGLTPREVICTCLEEGDHRTKVVEKIAKMLDNVNTKIRRCATCNAEAPKMHCPCKMASYCDTTCQRKNWKSHKTEHNAAMEMWKI